MFVELELENYRSIRDEVVLSAISVSRRPNDGVTGPGFYSKTLENTILPCIAIFGQNGAGKSNIIHSIEDLMSLLYHGSLEDIPFKESKISPFLFDRKSKNLPTKFKLTLLIEEIIYQYTLHITESSVLKEELSISNPESKKLTTVFSRTGDESGEAHLWQWNTKKSPIEITPGQKSLVEGLKKTRLFLSLLWSTFDFPLLNKMRDYTKARCVTFSPEGQKIYRLHVISRMKKQKDSLILIRKFLSLFDIPISRMEFNSNDQLISYHKNSDEKDVGLLFSDESDGTRQLLSISTAVLDSLKRGALFTVDELDAHLHPFITHQIIRLYQDPMTNSKNAQLVFTSHDTTLFDQGLLGRDQLYLADRGEQGETRLGSVADYGVRNDLVLDKAYLGGRFSALPILRAPDEFNEEVRSLLKDVDE
ncbi:MAG: ATP/GTP-binding protein [Pseudobdellovibrionaceae bacterium]